MAIPFLSGIKISTAFSSTPSDSIFLYTSGSNTPGGGNEIIFGTSTSATTANYNAKVAGVRSSLDNGSSDLQFLTTHVADSIAPSTRMTIKSDGKIGVGTASPTYKLEVSEDGGDNGTADLLFLRNSNSTRAQTFQFQLDTAKDLVITGSSGAGGFKFVPGSRGTTFTGDINTSGNIYLNNNKTIFGKNTSGSNYGLLTITSGNVIKLGAYSYTSAATEIGLGNNGKFLIGTAEALSIDNSKNATFAGTLDSKDLTVTSSGDSTYFGNFLASTGSAYAKFYQDSNNHVALYMAATGGTANIVLNSSGVSYIKGGNLIVGGSSDSGEKLQVEGTIASGNINISDGTPVLTLTDTSSSATATLTLDGVNLTLQNNGTDGDFTIIGKDGSSNINLLAFDTSEGGDATFSAKVRANSWFQGADGTNTLYSNATAGTIIQTPGSTANNNDSKIYFKNHGTTVKHTFDTNSGDATFAGAITWSGGSSANANTAYSWGNHASAGYLTSVPSNASALNLNATDDRDMAPEDLSYSDDMRIFFSAREGLEDGTSTGTDWQDVILLNSYSDSSGGNANILAFDKNSYKIRHYQAGLTASNWGTAKTLAYLESPSFTGDITVSKTDPKITLFDNGGANTDPSGSIAFSESSGYENFDITYNGANDRLEFRGRVSNNDNTDLAYINRDLTTTLEVLGGATFAGIVDASRYVATGQNLSHGASRLKISQENTTLSEIRFYGANTSTAGALRFMGSSSDGSVGGVRLTLNADGSSAFSGNVSITGDTASPHSDNAFIVYRGSDGSNALRVQNSGEVVVQNNYLYAAGAGTSLYVQAGAVIRGDISNDGGDVRIADNLVVTGDLTVEGTNTILKTQTVEVEDNILQLNTTQGSPDTATATTSGISIYRGVDGSSNPITSSFVFDDADDTWDLTDNLKVAGTTYLDGFVTIDHNLDITSSGVIRMGGTEVISAARAINAASGTFTGTVSAEDNIHLTDAGTVRAKLLLNASDRDNVELRAESLGSTMKFFTVGTEALELDASQNATFAGDILAEGGDITVKDTGTENAMFRAYATGSGYAGIIMDASNGDGSGSDYFTLRQLDNKQVEFNSRVNAGTTLFYSKGALNLTQDGANSTFAGSVTISGNIQFSDGYLFANSVTSSSTTTTVASVSSSTYTAVFFDYSIKNGTNVRAGTVVATHDGTNVEFNETSTVDLGDTSDVTLSVDLVSSNLSLKATTTSSTWTVKSLVRAI